jgi:hypothetical protein
MDGGGGYNFKTGEDEVPHSFESYMNFGVFSPVTRAKIPKLQY